MSHEMVRDEARMVYGDAALEGVTVTIDAADTRPENDIVDVWALLPHADVFTPQQLTADDLEADGL